MALDGALLFPGSGLPSEANRKLISADNIHSSNIVPQCLIQSFFQTSLFSSPLTYQLDRELVASILPGYGVPVSGFVPIYGNTFDSAVEPLESSLCLQSIALYGQGMPIRLTSALTRFFGANANQDQNNVYLLKSDLPNLTSLSVNTFESLFVAIMLQILNYESSSKNSNIVIEIRQTSFFILNGEFIQETVLLLNFYRLLHFDVQDQIINRQSAITPSNINN